MLEVDTSLQDLLHLHGRPLLAAPPARFQRPFPGCTQGPAFLALAGAGFGFGGRSLPLPPAAFGLASGVALPRVLAPEAAAPIALLAAAAASPPLCSSRHVVPDRAWHREQLKHKARAPVTS